jgi:hypothetical protein
VVQPQHLFNVSLRLVAEPTHYTARSNWHSIFVYTIDDTLKDFVKAENVANVELLKGWIFLTSFVDHWRTPAHQPAVNPEDVWTWTACLNSKYQFPALATQV